MARMDSYRYVFSKQRMGTPMNDGPYRELQKEIAELREKINVSSAEAKEYALHRSEKARNTAIGVFSFIALILGIIGFLGLDDVVKSKLDDLGSEEILSQAREASDTALQKSEQVVAAAAKIDELVGRYTELYETLPSKFTHIVTANNPAELAKTGWRDMPSMKAEVELAGGTFLILFQASGVQSAHANNAVRFQLLVDGRQVALARHEFSTVGWALRNVNLQALEPLDAGVHTIVVQWEGAYDGKTTQLSRYDDTRSLIIVEQ